MLTHQILNEPASTPERMTFWRIAATGIIWISLVAIALLLWNIAAVLLLVFGGILVALLLRSLAGFVTARLNVSEGAALAVVMVAVLGLAGLVGYFVGEPLVGQMTELSEEVPRALRTLREQVAATRVGRSLLREAPQSVDELPIAKDDLARQASDALGIFTAGLAGTVVVGFIGIYLAIDMGRYLRGTVRLVPPRRRERLREVLAEVASTLRWWLLGKFVSMAVVGVLTILGLWLLGVPLAFALGVLAALLTFIPNFGPIVSAIPAVLLGLLQSPLDGLYVILLYVGIQTIESYVITPLVQQRTASLPPALTISAQLALGITFGGLGVIMATPLTAAALVLVKRLYIEDVLEQGDRTAIATNV